jgi:(R,R)-butanediol dehydrogenase / meso-butanediol dehydrogenase / diacetyl reductase
MEINRKGDGFFESRRREKVLLGLLGERWIIWAPFAYPAFTMRAAIYTGPRKLEICERPMPQASTGEVLLEIRRVGICGTDLMIFQGHMQDRARPGRILGHEVVAIVREKESGGIFNQGDRVVVEPTLSCGECQACRAGHTHVCRKLRLLGIDEDGAFREFCAVPEHRLHTVPDSIPDDHAAMIEPLAVAVHAVRLAALRAEDTVAIIGGGTIGLLIAMLARKAGTRVVVLEINLRRLRFARGLQVEAFNPQEQDAAGFILDVTRGAGADVIFEASGSPGGARAMTALAAVRGRVMIVGIQGRETPADLFQVFFRELSIQGTRAYASHDFKEAIRLVSGDEINLAPFISKHSPLERIQETMEAAIASAPTMKILIDPQVT